MCLNVAKPKVVLLFSGKRKCGKDYLTALLLPLLEKEAAEVIRISEPIKSHWAKEKGLDLEKLLADGPYKEIYRKEMIEWSDSVRAQDYGYFCREAMKRAQMPIVIVSDVRRRTDIEYFKHNYNIKTIRIEAMNDVRQYRGWEFEDGVDNVQSECDLDDFEDWDFRINNDGTEDINLFLTKIADAIRNEILNAT